MPFHVYPGHLVSELLDEHVASACLAIARTGVATIDEGCANGMARRGRGASNTPDIPIWLYTGAKHKVDIMGCNHATCKRG